MDATGTPAVAAGEWEVPASYAQERVWFASQLAPETTVYKLLDQYTLAYPLPAERIRAALATLCSRHEPLRTSFRRGAGGELMQVVHEHVEPPVTDVDLSAVPAPERQRRVGDLLLELIRTDLPLDRAPLWRATLVRHGDADWELLLVAHHVVLDAGGLLVLRDEVERLCRAELAGTPAELPELPIQYADYAVWQRGWLAGGRLAELLDYWRGALAGLPAVHGIRTDRPRPSERTFDGDDVVRPLPAGSRRAAEELARRTGSTPFMVMFSAWVAVLHLLSGDEDVVVGLPVAGRDQPELRSLVGMFVNVLVIRVDVTGRPTFGELLDRVRLALLAAWDAQEMPFQKLVEELAPVRVPGLPPLYQLGFNYLDIGFSRRQEITAEDDLTLEVCGDGFRVEYATALFDRASAERIAAEFARVLGAVLAEPGVAIAELAPAARPADRAVPPAGPAGGTVPPGGAEPVGGYVPPRTAAEELVAGVWAEVLGRDRVGALDDFFDLGGHSLLALRVIARLSAAAGVDLPIQAFFADTTVAGVAGELERILAAELDEMTEDEAERLVAGNGQDA